MSPEEWWQKDGAIPVPVPAHPRGEGGSRLERSSSSVSGRPVPNSHQPKTMTMTVAEYKEMKNVSAILTSGKHPAWGTQGQEDSVQKPLGGNVGPICALSLNEGLPHQQVPSSDQTQSPFSALLLPSLLFPSTLIIIS